jgi:hypothetical protein
MQTDYKSHELNLYSGDNKCHLFVKDGRVNPEWAPGFGQNQKFQYLRYTEVEDAGYMHPIVVAGLHYLDTNGFVSGVGWSFYEVKNSIADEVKNRTDADAKLTTDLATEVKARQDAIDAEAKARSATDQSIIATIVADNKMHTDNFNLLGGQIVSENKARINAVANEAKLREDGDAFLQAQVGGLWGGLQTIEADSKTRDSALDVKLSQESSRAQGAEASLSGRIDTEISDRVSEINRLEGRINFIANNSDGAAIDSLSELLAEFSQNGQGIVSRLGYLESVVLSLVNKSQS